MRPAILKARRIRRLRKARRRELCYYCTPAGRIYFFSDDPTCGLIPAPERGPDWFRSDDGFAVKLNIENARRVALPEAAV